ncbi:histone H1-like [Clarias gariepinus]|uniref:histone H1-like n=1 Tax=Clarias gariepinus TaxID=13013 RepID=UPI00234D7BC2|nr:histone H1-like [Clarias gariepinus]
MAEMNRRFGKVEFIEKLADATCLNPRFKKQAFVNQQAADETGKRITTAAAHVNPTQGEEETAPDYAAIVTATAMFWEDFDERRSVGKLIIKVVSTSKERSGVSLPALKKALAAGGYDVEKNNSRVKLAVNNLVKKAVLVQTKAAKKPAAAKNPKKVAKTAAAEKSPKKAKKPAVAAKKVTKSPKKAKKPVTPKKAAKSPKKAKTVKPKTAKPKASMAAKPKAPKAKKAASKKK